MEEQKLQMEREMNEMRAKMEKMSSPVVGKPQAQMKTSLGVGKPKEQKRPGQSTFYKVTVLT